MLYTKKNVLIFLNAFWNYGKGMSGGDQMLIQVFKRIEGDFGTIHCYTNSDGRDAINKETRRFTFQVAWRICDRCNLLASYALRTLKAVGCVFIKDMDIIYSGSDFFPDVVPAYLYKLTHPRAEWFSCVFHIYPDWRTRPGGRLRNLVGQLLQRFSLRLIRRADTIININQQVRAELLERGFEAGRIVINPPGIDLEVFEKETAREGNYDGVFLARLNPSKGIFDLVEVWKEVAREEPAARLGIIGGGAEETIKELKGRIESAGLGGTVDVLGFQSDERARALMRGAKVFLFPSHEEGFGIAIAEAMAAELPVVAWSLPVYKEVFEQHLRTVPEADVAAFAREVVEVIHSRSEPRVEAAVEQARRFVRKYSWDAIAGRHREILYGHNGGTRT